MRCRLTAFALLGVAGVQFVEGGSLPAALGLAAAVVLLGLRRIERGRRAG